MSATAPAYRTISDVATLIGVPHHVLRFWETKFPVIAPLKRGGGRRYYRPEDIAAIERIACLLQVEGYTIKGVQRLLTESAPAAKAAAASIATTGPAIVVEHVAAIRADLAAALSAARAL